MWLVFGVCHFGRYYLGVSFLNIVFYKVVCNVFMKNVAFLLSFASKLLVSIKVLYKLNSFVAYFCQHHWLQCIV